MLSTLIAGKLALELESARKSKASGSERLMDVQKEAIRELYEDLTGITISTIDPCEASGAQVDLDESPRWRFKAFFSALAHYGEKQLRGIHRRRCH